jgi:hypothetical protein
MSRFYDMRVEVDKCSARRVESVIKACCGEWDFRDIGSRRELKDVVVRGNGEGNLGGGESEEEFADRLCAAIWKANKGYCPVTVTATYLEDLPFEMHERKRNHYEAWLKKAA